MLFKEMKIFLDEKQTRTAIPQKFAKIMNVEEGDKIGWTLDENRKELTAFLLKEKELKKIKEEEQWED